MIQFGPALQLALEENSQRKQLPAGSTTVANAFGLKTNEYDMGEFIIKLIS